MLRYIREDNLKGVTSWESDAIALHTVENNIYYLIYITSLAIYKCRMYAATIVKSAAYGEDKKRNSILQYKGKLNYHIEVLNDKTMNLFEITKIENDYTRFTKPNRNDIDSIILRFGKWYLIIMIIKFKN